MPRNKYSPGEATPAGFRITRAVALAVAASAFLLQFFAPAVFADEPHKGFHLQQLDGSRELTLEDFRGTVVYLDFWASWCGPCRKSLPLYDALYRELGQQTENTRPGSGPAGHRQFSVVAINLDEDRQDAVRFLEKHPVSYPVLLDPQGVTAANWQVKVMPSSFLLDRSGAVVKEYAGFEEAHIEEIRHDIEELLASPASP